MRRRAAQPTAPVRKLLADFAAARCLASPHLEPWYGRILRSLDDGRDVIVPGWLVAKWVPDCLGHNRVLLAVDGRVEPVEPRKDPISQRITGWVSVQ